MIRHSKLGRKLEYFLKFQKKVQCIQLCDLSDCNTRS
uniref:Uncharacterized protein n=1 Tax=Anguilla anguilla TaxID=7936 RepID=A0A0E9RRK1_ANGAN